VEGGDDSFYRQNPASDGAEIEGYDFAGYFAGFIT
jgi:hypothetical protein